MKKLLGPITVVIVFFLLLLLFSTLIRNGNLQLLNPKGIIAEKQSQILWIALFAGTLITATVVGIMLLIAFRYRDGRSKKYTPDWTGGKLLIFGWWALPAMVIAFFAIGNWFTAHDLDPYKPINSSAKPISVQVVALNWKWLFIYPDEKIATVNFLEIPVGTPVNFQLTADGPMNSFWIPSLGGQIYAMSGMSTSIHLEADKIGQFPGGAAEINGDGFSKMNFVTNSVSATEYKQWVQSVKHSGKKLDRATYDDLAKPSIDNTKAFYIYADQNLYNEIMMKYMKPSEEKTMKMERSEDMKNMPGM